MAHTELCPLCQHSNNCCHSQDKSANCWCTDYYFPPELFAQIPKEELRKTCVCLSCLEKFTTDR